MQYTQQDYDRAQMVFLLDIDWNGQQYGFSSFPISFDGREYTGSLSEVTYTEQTDIVGLDVEANSFSCAVHFDGLDMVQEWRRGRTLEGVSATLSYILVKDGEVYSSSAVLLLKGIIQEPVIGDPEEPVSFAAFTVEQKPYDIEVPIIGASSEINERKHPNADETALGKFYPVIIGKAGQTRKGSDTEQLFATPAYNHKAYDVGSPAHEVLYIVAGHACVGTEVQISDNVGSAITKTIESGVDEDNQIYSFIDLTSSALLYPGATSLSNNATHPSEFWVTWTNGGGITSPYREGVLEGGGDICRWALSRTGVEIDHGAWANIAPILNMYKFAGYINDSSMTTAQFLEDHILPFLPIEIRSGPKGLRPILAQYIAIQNVEAVVSINAGDGDWQQISALETRTNTSEIYNACRINYAYNSQEDSFFHTMYVGPEGQDKEDSKKNLYALSSSNRYGISQQTFDAFFIYDPLTASRVAGDFIRRTSFPVRYIQFSADIEYGWLQLGDVISLTSTALYLEGQKCTIVAKQWDVTNWIFTLMFDDSPIHLDRAT